MMSYEFVADPAKVRGVVILVAEDLKQAWSMAETWATTSGIDPMKIMFHRSKDISRPTVIYEEKS